MVGKVKSYNFRVGHLYGRVSEVTVCRYTFIPCNIHVGNLVR